MFGKENKIGTIVRKRRIELGLTLRDLSDRTVDEKGKKLSIGHISEIENGGRTNLQITTLKRLARGLNVDVMDLIETKGG